MHNDNEIANNNITKVLENALLAKQIPQGVLLKMSNFDAFEKYQIFILRNTHSSRGLSRNVKVMRLCLRNTKSSTYVKIAHCSRNLNENVKVLRLCLRNIKPSNLNIHI